MTPRRTFHSVITELIDGLASGKIVLEMEENNRLRALATELFDALQWLTIAAEEGTPARSEHVRMAQMALKKARQQGLHGA